MPKFLKNTRFQDDWLRDPRFSSWARKLPNDATKVLCKLCNRDFSLSNMGTQALPSHIKGKKHQQAIVNPLTPLFFAPTAPLAGPSAEPPAATPAAPTAGPPLAPTAGPSTEPHAVPSAEPPRKQLTITDSISDQKKLMVLNAEIRWALKSVLCHYSSRSNIDIGQLFASMFPDSKIAQEYSMGKDKVGYFITYGIAHIFSNS